MGDDPHPLPSMIHNPTTRDLLDAAATYVAEKERHGLRPAKARVHAMPLTELLALPPVRLMLVEAANAAAR